MRQYRAVLTQRARTLRKDQTDAEKLLWSRLRNRQLRELKFQRQYMLGNYIVDFICHEYKLVIELDGGQHNTETVQLYDKNRTTYFKSLGFGVLRFWNNDVLKNVEGVLSTILSEVDSRELSP